MPHGPSAFFQDVLSWTAGAHAISIPHPLGQEEAHGSAISFEKHTAGSCRARTRTPASGPPSSRLPHHCPLQCPTPPMAGPPSCLAPSALGLAGLGELAISYHVVNISSQHLYPAASLQVSELTPPPPPPILGDFPGPTLGSPWGIQGTIPQVSKEQCHTTPGKIPSMGVRWKH